MKNKIISGIIAITMMITLCIPVLSPIVSFASEGTIYIYTTEEFLDFAKKCSYDAWSKNKQIILKNDISLLNTDFESIAIFNGSFDGEGHTISGLNIDGTYSPSGLFSVLGKDGAIKNLTVQGSVTPNGDKRLVGGIVGDNYGLIENCSFIGTIMGKTDVGGIAGVNRISGTIKGCSASGEVIGESRTGGLAGSSAGLISSSVNSAKVNTISVTPKLSLDEINISLTLDISKLPSLNNSTMTDTGGIAGYSTGIIMGCTNNGRVGYPHIGYNAGGIAGRSSGHLTGNRNNAEIYGRKDVGGIVGQMEPYINYTLSEDLLASLKVELDELSALVNEAVAKADGSFNGLSARLDNILTSLDDATDSLNNLMNDVTDYGDDMIGEVNRISDILTEVLSQLYDISADAPTLSSTLGDAIKSFESAIEGLKEVFSFTDEAIYDLDLMTQDAAEAFGNISSMIDKIDRGVSALEGAIEIDDKAAAETALNNIADGLSELVTASDSMATAIGGVAEVINDTAWADQLIPMFDKAADAFNDMSLAIKDIYDATTVIKDNVDVNWQDIKEGGDKLLASFDSMTLALGSLNESLYYAELAINDISSGIEILYNALMSQDQDAINGAIQQITNGFKKLVEATEGSSKALSDLADAMQNFEMSNMTESFQKIGEALGTIADQSESLSTAITEISEGMTTLLQNIEIDPDAMEEGGALILSGFNNLGDSLTEMRGAVSHLSDGMTSLSESIHLIKNAITVKDESALAEAFDKAYTSMGVIIDSVGIFAEVMTEVADVLEEAKLWSDRLSDAFVGVTNAFTDITAALTKVQGGIDSLRANISLDLTLCEEGLSLIRDGFKDLGLATANIKDTLLHLSDAFADVQGAIGAMDKVAEDFSDGMSSIAEATDIITEMSNGAVTLLGYLKSVDKIQFPTPPESITATANQLFASISQIENELKQVNADMTDLENEIVTIIGKISNKFESISENIIDLIYGLDDYDIINNKVTEEEIDSVTNGKVFSCVNYGSVYADRNVGGIAGAMGLEYALDPEDDASDELSVTQKKQYLLKAVIHACQNYGDITSKKDAVGGITGKMDLGLIYGSESYCSVTSEAGNYVGGVAGISAGLISQCFVKSTLSGGKYIGGVVGSGVDETYSGDSSMVRNCYTMVEIVKFTQYAGAIAGAGIGQYSENLFVSDTLQGIDRASYEGKAEPISYEDLIKRRSLPQGFYSFTLKFVADGVVISTTQFQYGESFDESVFPEIPKKDGHYGLWDRTDLTKLVFDTTVSVIYTPYSTTIVSEEKRDDGRNIFIVEGEFTADCALTVTHTQSIKGLELADKFFTKDTLIEGWVLQIPTDNMDVNTIHFLARNEHCKIFVKLDGVWTEVETKEFGSYLLFDVSGENVELAIVEHTIKLVPVIAISATVLGVIAVVIIILAVKKKAAKKDVDGNEQSENAEEKPEEKPEKKNKKKNKKK